MLPLTTNVGQPLSTDQNSLKAGVSALLLSGDVIVFVAEAYKHAKSVGADTGSVEVVKRALTDIGGDVDKLPGVFADRVGVADFVEAVGERHWGRPRLEGLGA